MNRISNIIPEEELDVKDYQLKSPYGGALEGNMISAIGMQDITDGR